MVNRGAAPQFAPEQHVRGSRNYAAMIKKIHLWPEVFADKTKGQGNYENTVIVYFGDYGETLGDHILLGTSFPGHASAGARLLDMGTGIRQGFDCDAMVSAFDLIATFVD